MATAKRKRRQAAAISRAQLRMNELILLRDNDTMGHHQDVIHRELDRHQMLIDQTNRNMSANQ